MKQDIKILSFKDLENKLLNSFNKEEIKEIKDTFLYAEKEHAGEKRKSGEDYIQHPLNVACILADLNVDAATIKAGLLHDVIGHKKENVETIKEMFGEEVAKLAENVNLINDLKSINNSESSYIYARKILVGLSEDVRVIFIKLADRLHNMRTVWALSPEFQKIKANETINILIPIAHRLGVNSIKSELEDLSLKYLKPDVYQDILNKLDDSREQLNFILNNMKDSITEILLEQNLNFKIKARVKSVFSIYEKLEKGKKFSDIYDILALRVILDSERDCYLAVGLIHAKYRPIPKRFKDYIAMPKENMYQSLHTSVFGDNGYIFEIQLRTEEMDEIAENGIASHWSYKENGVIKSQNIMDQKLEMFKNLIDQNIKNNTELEFESSVNNEFLSEYIYVFTPKGDVVELPSKATPIDFAYRIHSNVGHKTVGAIVNDNIVPLNYELNDGDIVNIMTNNASKPKKSWLNIVKTTQAKNKIKAYFSKQDREEYINKGKYLLEKEIRKRKLVIEESLSNINLDKVMKDIKVTSIDEIYLSVGSLRFTPSYIINLIYNDKHNVDDLLLTKINKNSNINNNYKKSIIVSGIDNIRVNLSKCCKPIYGDDIVGFISKGNGINVHKKDCKNILNETDRIIEVSWNENSNEVYFTDIIIFAENKNNILLDIMTIASSKNCYIEKFKILEKDINIKLLLTIKIKNQNDLYNLIMEIKKLKYIKDIVRS